ncbi:hypothetical protein SMC1_09390 [Candidatus Cryosericum septentrionale]|uniref:RNA polymerase sigma-70 region 4 domain-containing protein n=1 Tax=Candidatus Cryosericum septentrionale TaxID=2290913 RepID=A0A398DLM4_9BACT|nr:hypothetical protein SMC1_09390 [Candidatus Cryosericum septentrionale]
MLSQTLPQLWHLSDDESDALWRAFESLPLTSVSRSAEVSAGLVSPFITLEDDIELVLTATTRYLMRMFDGPDAFRSLLESLQKEVALTIGHEVQADIWTCASPIIESVPQVLRDLRLATFRLCPALAHFCQTNEMTTLGSLRGVTEGQILTEFGLGINGLTAVEHCYALSAMIDALPEARLLPSGETSLEALVRRALVCGIKSPDRGNRAYDVHLYRLGLLTGRRETHRAIGELLGVTGARVDQIEKRSLRGFDSAAFLETLLPFRVTVVNCLLANGGALGAHDLAEGIAVSMQLGEAPPETAVLGLAEIIPECEMATNSDVVIFAGLPCLGCGVVGRVLDEIEHGQMAVPLQEAAALVEAGCEGSRGDHCLVDNVSPLVIMAAAAREENLALRRAWVIPNAAGPFRPDSLAYRADEVLRREARPMHFNKVHAVLGQEGYRSDSARNVHACLDRSSNAVLWDRGTYVHKDHMPFPYALLRDVEDWIRDCLAGPDGLPMMSVHGVFEHFRSACEAQSVPSESALYSLLRMSADAELRYPRYPRIFSSRGYDAPVPLSVAIGEYVRAAGQPVSSKELKALVVGRMGFKEFQLGQALAWGIPSTLRTAHSALVHEDYVDVDPGALDKCVRHAAGLLRDDSQVSIKRVFDDLKVDCVLGGIDSPELLFSLMRLSDAHGVTAAHYPLLAHSAQDAPTSVSVLENIEEYVRAKKGPCSYQELEEEFVERRKYSAPTVYAIVHRHHVYRYLPGSVIHEDSIGLSTSDFEVVYHAAAERFAADIAAGNCFSTIRAMLEEDVLPEIAVGVVWTEQLVASMLERTGGFLLLGNGRNAFATRPNPLGIEIFGDLVSWLVRRDYGGGVKLSVLESRLRDEGVILKQLTASMLDGQGSVSIRGMEVVATEGVHA